MWLLQILKTEKHLKIVLFEKKKFGKKKLIALGAMAELGVADIRNGPEGHVPWPLAHAAVDHRQRVPRWLTRVAAPRQILGKACIRQGSATLTAACRGQGRRRRQTRPRG